MWVYIRHVQNIATLPREMHMHKSLVSYPWEMDALHSEKMCMSILIAGFVWPWNSVIKLHVYLKCALQIRRFFSVTRLNMFRQGIPKSRTIPVQITVEVGSRAELWVVKCRNITKPSFCMNLLLCDQILPFTSMIRWHSLILLHPILDFYSP